MLSQWLMNHPTASFCEAVRLSAVSPALIQFPAKSQNAQPRRLPFWMTPHLPISVLVFTQNSRGSCLAFKHSLWYRCAQVFLKICNENPDSRPLKGQVLGPVWFIRFIAIKKARWRKIILLLIYRNNVERDANILIWTNTCLTTQSNTYRHHTGVYMYARMNIWKTSN